jgi:hypothetical protein
MAESYKALRGRIHAINNTSAPAPGQGPNGYTRYSRVPLPLVIGSASFAADDWAGLAAPIAKHVEEETWVSDEEDDLPLVRRRHTFSKVRSVVSLCSKYTMILTSENFCAEMRHRTRVAARRKHRARLLLLTRRRRLGLRLCWTTLSSPRRCPCLPQGAARQLPRA